MNARPAYFEAIRNSAAETWELLNGRPDIAAPWHQQFKQVQSPRHILSELLQNADDAGAGEAAVAIENGCFVFSHNGEDFTEEHFTSLCAFGISNKRELHTIGFRGIGFKSIFILGERVELYTPTLSIGFDKKRFTEPFWIKDGTALRDRTTVKVRISDEHRQKAVEKNLEEWLKSPVSLLFFRNIRRITIGQKEVHWGSFGPGPIPQTEWLALHEKPDEKFLLAHSGSEHFPEDALIEIHEERMLSAEQEMSFPPCQIEVVIGVEGRLFVVLPTGVKTGLPFACNAPFIQDPARYKIKDPETSPTNRWLLERAGKLAADVMLAWLGNTTLHPEERAAAYDVMPDVDQMNSDLDSVCGAIVEKSFESAIQKEDILLAENGYLVGKDSAVVVPRKLFDVWPQDQATALFDEQGRQPLCHHIYESNLKKLKNWGAVEEIDHQDVLNILQKKHFPRPATWRQLLTLWTYINRHLQSYKYHCNKTELCIVPVQGKDILFAASEVIRLGEKRMVPSDEDWAFLGDRLSVLNQNWTRFLTEQRRNAEGQNDKALQKLIESADSLLDAIGLDKPSDTGKVIDQVAQSFFNEHPVKLKNAIRLAQIAAKLRAQIQSRFKYACQDKELRPISSTVIFDKDGSLSVLLPEEWADKHVLHPDYTKDFRSCSKEDWSYWASSGRAGLASFVPLKPRNAHWNKLSLNSALRARGYTETYNSRYSNPSFFFNDWNFDEKFWKYWHSLEDEMPAVWGRIAESILANPSHWTRFLTATVSERASNGFERHIIRDGLLPGWLAKLREKPCLRDINGIYHKPSELLMRSHKTEALMDIEPFVHGRLDIEEKRPLLKLLGVSDEPTGPEKILDRLKALAQTEPPLADVVEMWYGRLDQLIDGCSTEALKEIRNLFETERLILTESSKWENSFGVFLSAGEEDVPDVPLVRSAVRDLTLWRRVSVGDRPTEALAIEWLNKLASGKTLQHDDLRRAETLLRRYPEKVWSDCGHWLNLVGDWTPIHEFDYALTKKTQTSWRHLHQWVKQKTGDFRSLPVKQCETPPFSALPSLGASIEERFEKNLKPDGQSEVRPWLRELGRQLYRIKLDDGDERDRVQRLASTLSRTSWVVRDNIEIVPYIDGKPAGTTRKADVLWLDDILYAKDKTSAKIAKAVTQEIGNAFDQSEITFAIKLCFDREPGYIRSYFEENFDLVPEDDLLQSRLQVDGEVERPEEPTTASDSGTHDNSPDERGEGPIKDDLNDTKEAHDLEQNGADDTISEAAPGSTDTYAGETSKEDDNITYRLVKPRSTKPLLIERFAFALGFKKDGDSYYFNDDGQTLGKANGSLFPWELRDVSGNVTKHFWLKEHCLERQPLQLDAEIWGVLEREPESYVLVLADPRGEPIEVSGKTLTRLRDRGVLTLHPSTYRLVIEHEKQL